MSEIKVASRYAKSLIDLGLEHNALEEIKGDMNFFIETLEASSELKAVLKNPIIHLDKKKKILEAVFGNKVNKTTQAFFNLVVNKNRSEVLFPTAKEFLAQYNSYKNIVTAKVVSASVLTEEAKTEIKNKIKAATGGEVILNTSIDETLIGGFVLTVGDKQFDASVASKLGKLKKEFSQRVVA